MRSRKGTWYAGGSKARRSIGNSVSHAWWGATNRLFIKSSLGCAANILTTPHQVRRRETNRNRKRKPRVVKDLLCQKPDREGGPAFLSTQLRESTNQSLDIFFIIEKVRRDSYPLRLFSN